MYGSVHAAYAQFIESLCKQSKDLQIENVNWC